MSNDPTPRDLVESGGAVRAAQFAQEGARWINHVHVTSVQDAYMIIGSMRAAMSSLSDACEHLSRDMAIMTEPGDLIETDVNNGTPPDRSMNHARFYLNEAESEIDLVYRTLGRTQTLISGLAHTA